MIRRLTADLALEAGAQLGEGPSWDARDQRLWWTDIPAATVHRFDPDEGRDEALRLDREVAAIVPHADGGHLVAAREGFAHLTPDGALTTVAAVAPEGTRMNDGTCAPDGAFWAGTIASDDHPGTLYRLAPDGTVTPRLTGVALSNGIDFTADGTRFYYADTPTLRVDMCVLDPDDQTIVSREPFVTVDAGRPDGLTLDDDGCVWVAQIRAGRVNRYTPDGTLDTVVTLPVPWPTSCAFGGPDGRTLFITTAAVLRGEHHNATAAGALFAVTPNTTGQPTRPYRPI